MSVKIIDTKMDDVFPPPPVAGSDLLVPITTWADMYQETQVTGVEFDEFWLENVEDGVAYFFRWLGEPRATVLLIWDDEGPTVVECRVKGDLPASEEIVGKIIAEVTLLFLNTYFWRVRYRN